MRYRMYNYSYDGTADFMNRVGTPLQKEGKRD